MTYTVIWTIGHVCCAIFIKTLPFSLLRLPYVLGKDILAFTPLLFHPTKRDGSSRQSDATSCDHSDSFPFVFLIICRSEIAVMNAQYMYVYIVSLYALLLSIVQYCDEEMVWSTFTTLPKKFAHGWWKSLFHFVQIFYLSHIILFV